MDSSSPIGILIVGGVALVGLNLVNERVLEGVPRADDVVLGLEPEVDVPTLPVHWNASSASLYVKGHGSELLSGY